MPRLGFQIRLELLSTRTSQCDFPAPGGCSAFRAMVFEVAVNSESLSAPDLAL
jgi:hypothetical protein